MPLSFSGGSSALSSDLLARRCRFATFSHSFEAFGQQRTASGSGFTNITGYRGSHFWLQAMLGPERFVAPYVAAGKHGGKDTTFMAADAQLNAFIAECKAKAINTVLWIGLVNDNTGTLANTDISIANLTKIAKAITDAGMYLIVTDDTPAGAGSGTNYTRNSVALASFGRLQRWLMRDLPALSPLVIPVPIYHRFVSRTGTTGVPGDNSFFDAVDLMHPNVKGHFRYAFEIYKVLDKLFPPRPALMNNVDNAYQYDGALNKRGSLVLNPMLAGDNGSGLATSWGLDQSLTGLTFTVSKLTDADGTPVQQFAISGTAPSGTPFFKLRQDPSTAKFAQGDKHVGEAYVLIKAAGGATGYTNLRGVELQATLSQSVSGVSTNYTGQAGLAIQGDVMPNDIDWSQFNEGRGLYFRTAEEEILDVWPSTSPFARLAFTVILEAAVATDVVIQVRQMDWRKTFASSGF